MRRTVPNPQPAKPTIFLMLRPLVAVAADPGALGLPWQRRTAKTRSATAARRRSTCREDH